MWQGRYGAVAMDEPHLAAAARYVALNPVRARLVDRAEAWPWSSARAHLAGRDDRLVEVRPLLDRFGDFAALLSGGDDPEATRALRMAETTGRPVGNVEWVQEIERRSGRVLSPRKRGPKPKMSAAEEGISCI